MVTATSTVDRHGRIVIPAEHRRALGLRPGDEVAVLLEDGALRILTRRQAIRRAQALVAERRPAYRALSDELIAERRAEAADE